MSEGMGINYSYLKITSLLLASTRDELEEVLRITDTFVSKQQLRINEKKIIATSNNNQENIVNENQNFKLEKKNQKEIPKRNSNQKSRTCR